MRTFTRVAAGRLAGVFKILSTLLWLAACSSSPQEAPVQDLSPPPSQKLTHHTVTRGDTLFSIAWRYGLDYKALARRNGIDAEYRIYPGQRLALDVRLKPVAKPPPAKPKLRSKSQTKSAPVVPAPQPSNNQLRWRWPVQGKILQRFSPNNGLNKGIDIVGNLGQPVLSAAPGMVVYAGNGVRGYGNLLIVKHNQRYLSAYAHSRRILVREGDRVKAGQKIAEIGSSGTDRNKLHFEIRRNGKPVDPLKYLPKR
ncbi:peptidoglycan DD-metalloendopeptidase family protein [Exilibacterium tricleocarpae]|uniref:Peptidoglycan DD-metalloendopeptidase family protein n=1 Tax=Exilibacterium tricleocarpae TaxID=2591008 RepID=A0A545U5B8_9GAMM|nr:peptidoglycan DD-metalloendopeptidase family protein [Exilibacterium tricleocarpae]TQV84603.1 peptidoglycan DD-metalloendopeptidase family protein [Exilibacterium tricleocarpae]